MVGLVFSLATAVYGQDVGDPSGSKKNSDTYLIFIQPSKERVQFYKVLGYEKWVESILKAAAMLPEIFLEEVGTQIWRFRINADDWVTGNPGLINLLPSEEKPGWMNWEPFIENGFDEAEMIFVALHEIGHMYNFGSKLNILNTSLDFIRVELGVLETEPTLYGKAMGQDEDFAESLALYILWPEYLKKNFPLHYGVIRTILVREYKAVYPMPSSIRSRLAVKDDVTSGR